MGCGCRKASTRRPDPTAKTSSSPTLAAGRLVPAPGSNDRYSGPKIKPRQA